MAKIDLYGLWLQFGQSTFYTIVAFLFFVFSKKKQKIVMGVIFIGMLVVCTMYIDSIVSPKTETAEVTYIGYERNGFRTYIGGYCYHFKRNTDGSDIYLYTDIFTVKHLLGSGLTEGEEYIIIFETKSECLVGISCVNMSVP